MMQNKVTVNLSTRISKDDMSPSKILYVPKKVISISAIIEKIILFLLIIGIISFILEI